MDNTGAAILGFLIRAAAMISQFVAAAVSGALILMLLGAHMLSS
jgi:hypothetical protein